MHNPGAMVSYSEHSTIRLMLTLADVRPLIEGRPCTTVAKTLFPNADGEMPAGSLRQ